MKKNKLKKSERPSRKTGFISKKYNLDNFKNYEYYDLRDMFSDYKDYKD